MCDLELFSKISHIDELKIMQNTYQAIADKLVMYDNNDIAIQPYIRCSDYSYKCGAVTIAIHYIYSYT